MNALTVFSTTSCNHVACAEECCWHPHKHQWQHHSCDSGNLTVSSKLHGAVCSANCTFAVPCFAFLPKRHTILSNQNISHTRCVFELSFELVRLVSMAANVRRLPLTRNCLMAASCSLFLRQWGSSGVPWGSIGHRFASCMSHDDA